LVNCYRLKSLDRLTREKLVDDCFGPIKRTETLPFAQAVGDVKHFVGEGVATNSDEPVAEDGELFTT
jgi:hypothetical protein